MTRSQNTSAQTDGVAEKLAKKIMDLASQIPASTQSHSISPDTDAIELAKSAARNAALTAGSLSLPTGPWGWLTLIPELLTVWKIQAQMVSDLAALYGQTASLRREQMLYCLFKHTASQALRDLAVRVGERVLVKRASLETLQRVARFIGIKIAQRTLSKAVSRWVPVIGAIGVGTYAYRDTIQVARTAQELFSSHQTTEGSTLG